MKLITKQIIAIFILLALFPSRFILAQHSLMHPKISIDTSYTKYSALKKYIKNYPNISLATYIPKHKIKTYQNIVYQNYGTREMHLDLYEPDTLSNSLLPCVALIHGGGWSSGDKSLLDQFAMALADTGYVSVTIE